MYGVIGEDRSDVDMLKVIIRRLANTHTTPIRGKGYHGCAQMLRKGADKLRSFSALGCSRFVICYDADNKNPKDRYNQVASEIVRKSGLSEVICIVIPVQAIEAWILADVAAGSRIFDKWSPKEVKSPERVADPKKRLRQLSKNKTRPRYIPATHNQRMAKFLDLDEVQRKCPSFRPLVKLVTQGQGNYA